jgi:ABC-type phosphate transport system permease subunit
VAQLTEDAADDEGGGRTIAVVVIVLLIALGSAVAVGLAVLAGIWLRRRQQRA